MLIVYIVMAMAGVAAIVLLLTCLVFQVARIREGVEYLEHLAESKFKESLTGLEKKLEDKEDHLPREFKFENRDFSEKRRFGGDN